jgi:tetratricopeptide (TPR) repeat protein
MNNPQKLSLSNPDRRCSVCGSSIDPDDRFCGECGTPVKKSGAPSVKSPLELLQPSKEVTPYLDLGDSQIQKGQLSMIKQSPVAAKLAFHKISRTLREIYFDLGIVLSEHTRYTEAIEAFDAALTEKGSTPKTVEILLYLAHTCEQAGIYERAFHAYNEAILEEPEQASVILPHVHDLLTPDIVLAQGSQLIDKWSTGIKNMALNPRDRIHVMLFLGRVYLYLANYDQALEFFRNAMEADQKEATEVVTRMLTPERLPPALDPRKKDGNAHYVLAQIRHLMGHSKEALQEVNKALELGITGESKYPETSAYRLKAELLERAGEREQAGNLFYETGRRFYWQGDYTKAIEQFSHVAKLKPDHALAYWYWADSLRMNSYQQKPPYVNKAAIEESLRIWETGTQIQPRPSVDNSWVYVVRALINEGLARLSNDKPERSGLWWEAITYLERAILLYAKDAHRWAYLGRFYSSLLMESSALHTTRIALDHDSENLLALEERAAILANIGHFEEAEIIIDKRRKLERSAWADAVKAFILLYREQYQNALEIIDNLIKETPEDIWYYDMRALCYRLIDERVLAGVDYRTIWNRYDPLDINNQITCGWAAYSLAVLDQENTGLLDKAIGIFSKIRNDSTQRGDAYRYLGLCYLAQGNLERGEKHLDKGITLANNTRELFILDIGLNDIEKISAEGSRNKPIRETLTRIKKKIKTRKTELEQPLPLEEKVEKESKQIITECKRKGQTESWAWIGSHAGLARLYAEERRWMEVATIYQLLQEVPDRFPEARVGLEKSIDELQTEGGNLLKAGKPYKALKLFTQVHPIVQKFLVDDKKRRGDLYSRIGFAHLDVNDLIKAHIYFKQAIELYRENGIPNPGSTLGTVCRSLLRDANHYWTVKDKWKALEKVPGKKKTRPHDLEASKKALDAYLDELYQLSGQSAKNTGWFTMVTATAIEIEQKLLPEGPDAEWSLFKTYLPEMRARILEEMGVQIPSVRIRGNDTDMPPETYLIMLDEVPLVMGTLHGNMRYCPTAAKTLEATGIPDESLSRAPHPITGEPGCWVSPNHWETVIRNGFELWADPLIFMVYHLEAIIRQNMADFLGVQEVENLLEIWKEDTEGLLLSQATLPDQTSRLHFARVLRALVKEKVPITPWKDILETVQSRDLKNYEDTLTAVRAIRLRLKTLLPGNSRTAKRLELPTEVEDKITPWIWHKQGKTFFAIPPSETQELLTEIRELVPPGDKSLALVVHHTELRPFIRKLVELEFPHLMVLSQEELLSPDESREAPRIVDGRLAKGA